MTNNDQPPVDTADGRKISYNRWRYEETKKQERILAQVNDLLMAQATDAVSVGAGMSQQEYGGLLRLVVPELLDQYGNLNATAAVKFYDSLEVEWLKNNPQAYQQAGRGNVRRQASRYARARTEGALAVATRGQEFAARYADTYDLVAKSDRVVNYAMKVRAVSGHEPSVQAMNNALTREVASYHRDTVLFNAALDPYVSRVQRVAQATACEFCRLMALGSTNGKVRTSSYAVKFHDHCHCTIQPLFAGEEPFRPDYYDEFEKEYAEASKGGGSGKDVLARMRANAKPGKQPATVRPTKRYATVGDALDNADEWRDKVTFAQVVGQQANDPNGDSLLSYFTDQQGFNGKPALVKTIAELGDKPMFRGLASKADLPASEMVKQYLTKDTPYHGLGYFGNGTYFATKGDSVYDNAWEVARSYGSIGGVRSVDDFIASGQGIVAGFADNANVMEFDDPTALMWHMEGLKTRWKDECTARGIAPGDPVYDVADRFQGTSVMMVMDGVDAWVMKDTGYTVVVNRGKLKVIDR